MRCEDRQDLRYGFCTIQVPVAKSQSVLNCKAVRRCEKMHRYSNERAFVKYLPQSAVINQQQCKIGQEHEQVSLKVMPLYARTCTV
jgi:hypothetical protein